jgi:hypothetical protein
MANGEWRNSGGIGNSAFAIRHSSFSIVRGMSSKKSINPTFAERAHGRC